MIKRRKSRRCFCEPLEDRKLLSATPYGRNVLQPLDVDRSGFVTTLDALKMINALDGTGPGGLSPSSTPGLFLDVNGSGKGTPLDALQIINALARNQPVLAARLSNDSAPNGSANWDLLTNDYSLELGISVTETDQPLLMRINGSHVDGFQEIPNRSADKRVLMPEEAIDAVFGRPLPDGEHRIEFKLKDSTEVLDFNLTVDRVAPEVSVSQSSMRTILLESNEPLDISELESHAMLTSPNAPSISPISFDVDDSGMSVSIHFGNVPAERNYSLELATFDLAGNPGVDRIDNIRFDNEVVSESSIGLYDPMTGQFHLEWCGTSNVFQFAPPRDDADLKPLIGDWNGDGRDTLGLYDPATAEFHLKNYSEGYWDPSLGYGNRTYFSDLVFRFQGAESDWIPLTGDWNADGTDTVGLYDPYGSRFYLKNHNSNEGHVQAFQLGSSNARLMPLSGDWDGDGSDSIGWYDSYRSRFHLKNSLSGGVADQVVVIAPGFSNALPVSGDWDRDGIDSVGFYDPRSSMFHLKNETPGVRADLVFQFGSGQTDWIPLNGDFDGDGIDTIGLYNNRRDSLEDKYDPVRSEFHLKNSFGGGNADVRAGFGWHNDFTALSGDWNGDGVETIGVYDPIDAKFMLSDDLVTITSEFRLGSERSGWIAIAGDWDGDGRDSVGFYDPVYSMFHLRNGLSEGDFDIEFGFGIPASEWWPIAGDWDGDGIDTVGLYWREQSEFHLVNSHRSGPGDHVFQFGQPLLGHPGPILNWPGDFPVIGDWDGDGIDGVGLFDPEHSGFTLTNTFSSTQRSDESRNLGSAENGWWPIAGNWEAWCMI